MDICSGCNFPYLKFHSSGFFIAGSSPMQNTMKNKNVSWGYDDLHKKCMQSDDGKENNKIKHLNKSTRSDKRDFHRDRDGDGDQQLTDGDKLKTQPVMKVQRRVKKRT